MTQLSWEKEWKVSRIWQLLLAILGARYPYQAEVIYKVIPSIILRTELLKMNRQLVLSPFEPFGPIHHHDRQVRSFKFQYCVSEIIS